MKLSASDLFTLYERACKTAGGQSGYNPGGLAGQTQRTIMVWTEFHKEIAAYWPNSDGAAPKKAPSINPVIATEDEVSAAVKGFDWKAQGIMYKLLYNLGHRINR